MHLSADFQQKIDLRDALCRSAPAEEAGMSLHASVEAVMVSGCFDEPDPVALCRVLVAIAEANLPVARIVEGHVNAGQILALYSPDLDVSGSILGVWGADGEAPLQAMAGICAGGKRYASGLGTVEHAVVTTSSGTDDPARLALVDVTDTGRHRPGTWDMAGMRATVSGDIDLTGLPFEWIGKAGDYYREPHFLGGVWRIAALQLGRTLGLLGDGRSRLASGLAEPSGRKHRFLASARAGCGCCSTRRIGRRRHISRPS